MKIVVDTNIVFSALLNTNGSIGDVLFNSNRVFTFYSCNFLRAEIDKHWEKLISYSKLSDSELQTAKYEVFSKIKFINEELIPSEIWQKSERILENIDQNDIPFFALTLHLRASLWTGDKKLQNGLIQKNIKKVYNSKDLVSLRASKLRK